MISLNAGDLLLWESRLIHQNAPSLLTMDQYQNEMAINKECNIDLLRIVSYVCMTPKEKASNKIRKKRIKGYESGYSSNHNPHKPNIYKMPNMPQKPDYHKNERLDVEIIRDLVGFDNKIIP